MPQLSKLTPIKKPSAFNGASKSLAFIVSVLAISFSLSYLVSAWTEPSANPPTPNVSAPLNVGATGQSKQGGLILNTGGAATGLIVQSGDVLIGSAVTIKGDGSVSTGLNAAKLGGYTAADLLAAGGIYQGCWTLQTSCNLAAQPVPGNCVVTGAVEVGGYYPSNCGWGWWAGTRICCLPK